MHGYAIFCPGCLLHFILQPKFGYKVSLGLAWQITFQTNAAATFFIKILVAAALFHVCNAICNFTKPRSYSSCVLNKSSLHSVLLSPPAVSVVMLAYRPLPALRGFSGTYQRLYCICHVLPLHCVSINPVGRFTGHPS